VILNINPKTVQAWERRSREPGDAALILLAIAKNHPEILLENLEHWQSLSYSSASQTFYDLQAVLGELTVMKKAPRR